MHHWTRTLACLATALLTAAPGLSQDFGYLGWTSFSSNDALGDGGNRWQTSGSAYSFLFGPEGTSARPTRPFELVEFRARRQLVTPDNFLAPAAWDRPAAAVLTTTLHTHFEAAGFEISGGAGLAFTGPQTQLFGIQAFIHGMNPWAAPFVPDAVLNAQIGNGFHPTVHGEVARVVRLNEHVSVRPFVEGSIGVENTARIGADIQIGQGWDGALVLRDGVTGFTYHGFDPGPRMGISFIAGADTARVFGSALLPASQGYQVAPQRHRLRAGVLFEHERFSVFYGASWLSPEFAAQPAGQIVAGTKIKIRF